jgi:hypothetical protein
MITQPRPTCEVVPRPTREVVPRHAAATARLQAAMTSLMRLTSPQRAGSGSGITWLVAIWRALAQLLPSYG